MSKTQTIEEREAALTAAARAKEDRSPPSDLTAAQKEVVEAGATAFERGVGLRGDPFARGSAESVLWRSGWMGAVAS